MNMWVNVVLIFPRYFMITGLTVLALVFYSDTVRSDGQQHRLRDDPARGARPVRARGPPRAS